MSSQRHPPTASHHIENFLITLKLTKNVSPHTLEAYSRDLQQFQDTLQSHRQDLTQAQEKDIEFFLKKLKQNQQTPSSVARKLSAIKQFYKFLIKEGLLKEDPTTLIEAPQKKASLPKSIDPATIQSLLNITETGLPYERKFKEQLKLRDQAMVVLLYATGLRVSELIGLKTQWVDIEAGLLKVFGKRGKERIVPFVPFAGELLAQYLEQARPLLVRENSKDFVFLGSRGEPLTRQSFWRILKALAELAGIPKNLHPHMLRHTFATDLLKSGMNLRSLQTLLGHADLQTTQIYTQVTPDHLAKTIETYHPLGSPQQRRARTTKKK